MPQLTQLTQLCLPKYASINPTMPQPIMPQLTQLCLTKYASTNYAYLSVLQLCLN